MNKETFTFILALAGAGAWLMPVFSHIPPQKIQGKMISRYNNFNETQGLFLYKIAILSKNKPFNIKEVECTIKDKDGKIFSDKARNMRKVIFNQNEELQVHGEEYINNLVLLQKNQSATGYIFCAFDNMTRDIEISKTTFVFKSFNNKEKKLTFSEKDIDEKQLFYDDSLWKKIE